MCDGNMLAAEGFDISSLAGESQHISIQKVRSCRRQRDSFRRVTRYLHQPAFRPCRASMHVLASKQCNMSLGTHLYAIKVARTASQRVCIFAVLQLPHKPII